MTDLLGFEDFADLALLDSNPRPRRQNPLALSAYVCVYIYVYIHTFF